VHGIFGGFPKRGKSDSKLAFAAHYTTFALKNKNLAENPRLPANPPRCPANRPRFGAIRFRQEAAVSPSKRGGGGIDAPWHWKTFAA